MRRLLSVVLGTAFVVSCGSSTDSAAASIAGTYNLQTINGITLPFTITSSVDASKIVLEAEALTLTDAGSFLRADRGEYQPNGALSGFSPYARSDTGTFARTGSAVQFSFLQTNNMTATGTATGTVASGSLTLTLTGAVYVYTKAP